MPEQHMQSEQLKEKQGAAVGRPLHKGGGGLRPPAPLLNLFFLELLTLHVPFGLRPLVLPQLRAMQGAPRRMHMEPWQMGKLLFQQDPSVISTHVRKVLMAELRFLKIMPGQLCIVGFAPTGSY